MAICIKYKSSKITYSRYINDSFHLFIINVWCGVFVFIKINYPFSWIIIWLTNIVEYFFFIVNLKDYFEIEFDRASFLLIAFIYPKRFDMGGIYFLH
jgi:hypothetical protein